MIRLLSDMPDGVLGFDVVDDVEAEDYERVLVPAIEHALAEHGKVRLVCRFGPEFDEFEPGAIWADAKLGVHHPAAYERVAVVMDAAWANKAVRIASLLIPGTMRAFPLSELEAAKAWAASDA